MFENLEFTEILKLGFVGIAFLLAVLAFLLLRTEQGKDSPRPRMITSIYVFMAFSLILAGAALFLEARKTDTSDGEIITAYKSKLSKISGLIDAKLMHFLSNDSQDEFAKEFATNWKNEMQDAKNKGLID
ncbi:hypothetical protein NBZ79_16095 [Sneathiella marina]|uniref:Uncharacterized protein n=1 Tax=Sneathiella marina TaxID=2950108 RepID=A0ABY4W0J8_9PROT|nr:hypothetical protein [Sneathiella marina]USG60688.1 hypothetical protein NBZ79_16095 [Sneathiella marina]